MMGFHHQQSLLFACFLSILLMSHDHASFVSGFSQSCLFHRMTLDHLVALTRLTRETMRLNDAFK